VSRAPVRGVAVTASAYVLWGLSPVFWKHLDDVDAPQLIAFRVLATAVLLGAALAVAGRVRIWWAAVAEPTVRWRAALSAALLASNWLVFVWAVNDDRVLEVSLGYFMNPLLSVLLGVVVLGERMRAPQWAAIALAAVGVAVLTVDVGGLPWVSLYLAGSFACYGLMRKTSAVGSLDGLAVEVMWMAPFALAAATWLAWSGDSALDVGDPARPLLLLGAGAVTAAPLLLFARGARMIPLSLVGLLQYLAPTLQFLLGVVVYDEAWRGAQVVGYGLIWVALALFAADRTISDRARRAGGVGLRPGVR